MNENVCIKAYSTNTQVLLLVKMFYCICMRKVEVKSLKMWHLWHQTKN